MNLEIKIEGLEKLLAKLEAATREDVIKSSLTTGGFVLSSWSQKNRLSGPRPSYLGVRTNRLRSSISVEKATKTGNQYKTTIGTNVVYARIHEFGGMAGRNRKVFIPARPFLRPALEDVRNEETILRILTENINKAIERA